MAITSKKIILSSIAGKLTLGILFAASPVAGQPIADGRQVAQRNCAQCHAIGATGQSRMNRAPAFRDLSEIGEMDDLVAALRQGLLTHHPAMPQLRLTPNEITALAAYLREIQTKQSVSLKPRG